MKLTEFTNALNCVNIPHCYGPFPEEKAPPYITYSAIESNGIYADGMCLYESETISLELITHKRDICAENALECILNENHTPYTKLYEFDTEQKIHICTYEFATD